MTLCKQHYRYTRRQRCLPTFTFVSIQLLNDDLIMISWV